MKNKYLTKLMLSSACCLMAVTAEISAKIVGTTHDVQGNSSDSKVADLKKKLAYINEIDMLASFIQASKQHDKLCKEETTFKVLFPKLLDYYQFFADQGDIDAQYNYGAMLNSEVDRNGHIQA